MLLDMAGRRGSVAQKKFLYDRKGPWPQPSPTEPLGTSAEVLHLPWQEKLDWRWHIGCRYVRDLLIYAPVSCVKALSFSGLPAIDDAAMESVLTRGIYSRFLSRLDPADVETFAGIRDPTRPGSHFKLDFTPIEGVRPYRDMHVAQTITLLHRPDSATDAFSLLAIAVGKGRVVLRPTNGDAWQLAKYFVLQGCSYATLFTAHPNVHFPFDTINAITKGSVPVDHLLFKVLIPHLRFSLVLDNAVLQGKASVNNKGGATFYDPFTASADAGLMSLFVAGHRGIPGNSAYPRYRYPSNLLELEERLPPTKYGRFLRAYFEPFLELTRTVVAAMTDEELSYAEEWARWIRAWIETFAEIAFKGPREAPGVRHPMKPAERDMMKERLAFVLAVVLWDVSVVHSTDHNDFATDIPAEWKCFRLRRAAPSSRSIEPIDRRTLSTRFDIFKSYLAHRMFFAPTTVTRLIDVDYGFHDEVLRAAQARFKERLREVEASLRGPGIKPYMALTEMAASVQY